jgi:hypothetical protein
MKSALAVSLAAGALLALSAAPASAATIKVTAGTGSTISCNLVVTAKLSPALKNDWVASQHSTDPQGVIKALPTTTYASPSPVVTSAKGTGTCTGSAKDGVHTLPVTAVSLKIATDPAHPGTGPASCTSLLTGSTALFNATLKYTATGGKVNSTTITDMNFAPSLAPLGFKFSGGTIAGSFGGGTAQALGTVDTSLIGVVTQAPETGAQALAGSYVSLGCQPTLKVKALKTDPATIGTASLKAPKGLKKVLTLPTSTLALSVP